MAGDVDELTAGRHGFNSLRHPSALFTAPGGSAWAQRLEREHEVELRVCESVRVAAMVLVLLSQARLVQV